MRVVASGNLTVELIRAQRFDVACQNHVVRHDQVNQACNSHAQHELTQRCDRVELSPQTLASDPWAVDTVRADATPRPVVETDQTNLPDELLSLIHI